MVPGVDGKAGSVGAPATSGSIGSGPVEAGVIVGIGSVAFELGNVGSGGIVTSVFLPLFKPGAGGGAIGSDGTTKSVVFLASIVGVGATGGGICGSTGALIFFSPTSGAVTFVAGGGGTSVPGVKSADGGSGGRFALRPGGGTSG